MSKKEEKMENLIENLRDLEFEVNELRESDENDLELSNLHRAISEFLTKKGRD